MALTAKRRPSVNRCDDVDALLQLQVPEKPRSPVSLPV